MLTRTTPTSLERITRPVALLIITSLVSPVLLAGCGNNQQAAAPPPRDATPGEMSRINPGAAPTRQGMSTRKKLVLLAGAAALYYMYKKKRDAANQPTNVQYYRSKNGRIYYRDPRNPRQAIWVSPPRQGFQVPADEAMQYEGFQGYNGSNNGRDDFSGLIPTAPSNF